MTSMWIVIIKNTSLSDYPIDDLGIQIDATSSIDFHDQFSYSEIVSSEDLRNAVQNGDLVVNDGTKDLWASEGVYYLSLENLQHLQENHYNKTELQTPGQAEIAWGNIQGAPDVNNLDVDDGILYVYDSTRIEWLSVQRLTFTFGRRGRTRNQYLNFASGILPSNNSGYRLSRNATIVSMSGQLDAVGTCDIELRKNDLPSTIASLNISASLGNHDTTINISLDEGDYLQSYLSSSTFIRDPMVVIEIAWRL